MLPASVPISLRPLLERAEAFAAQKNWSAAIATLEEALAKAPNDAYVLVQLSYMHSLRGGYRAAETAALAAAAVETTDPQILQELLPRLRTFNRVPEMIRCIERALPMSRMPIPLLIAVAAQLSYVNLPERAISFLDEARRADPGYPSTLLARAQVLTYLGRFSEAQEDIKRSVRRAPEIAQSYWLQAWLRRQTSDQNHVDVIRRELARPGRPPNDIALLSFALHKELDDLGRYEEAWSALMHACRAKRSQLQYDAGQTQRLFAALEAFEPRSTEGRADRSSKDATPIFIVGMHRSGTTLLEQMLDGHPEVSAIGELYDFTSAMRFVTDHHCKGVIDEVLVEKAQAADLSLAGRRYLDGVSWRIGERRWFTDKLPSNFLNVAFIAAAMPHARILHMTRDPVETCFSNLRELFSDANAYSYDMLELSDYFKRYRDLMRSWEARFAGRILRVNYSDLVAEPEGQLRRVTQFCGLDFHPSMLDIGARKRAVVTASAVQVRRSVEKRETPKWTPYASWLAPLINNLSE
ncbi:MAG TPA: sulfotransferase [Steroidobacteraceae bacterium]|nr:sulfotransferase [Steroidobacteraceae bacterium]